MISSTVLSDSMQPILKMELTLLYDLGNLPIFCEETTTFT